MNLNEILRGYRGKKISIMCVGNEMRADDSFGIMVYKRIRGLRGAQIINCGVAPENFVEEVARFSPSMVLIVDAVDAGKEVGSLIVARARDVEGVAISTHKLPFSILDKYLSSRIGADVFVVGVQAGNVEFGGKPSPEVVSRAKEVAEAIRDFLS